MTYDGIVVNTVLRHGSGNFQGSRHLPSERPFCLRDRNTLLPETGGKTGLIFSHEFEGHKMNLLRTTGITSDRN